MGKAKKIFSTLLKAITITYMAFGLPPAWALSLNGYTDFVNTQQINAGVSGSILSVHVKPGQKVLKGDLLVKLDATPYRIRLDKAQALERSLLPAAESARLELERAQELYDRDSLSEVELKNAENKLAEADGVHQAAQADSLLAEYDLNNCIIRSTIEGRVLEVNTNPSYYVDPAVQSTVLLTLVESHHMKAIALINPDQWSSALINKKATVKFRGKIFHGKVSYIGYKGEIKSSGLPAYEVQVTFNTSTLIPAEMPVSIEVPD